MKRRLSHEWALPEKASSYEIDVLIPSMGRAAELAVTLASLAAQDNPGFRVIVADQSDEPRTGGEHPAVEAMVRLLRAQGRPVTVHTRRTRRGVAEQRQFLLEQSHSPLVLYLDNDVWLEPGALETLHRALEHLQCGFVGMAVQGLSYLADSRPQERATFQCWEGPVCAESLGRHSRAFARWELHNAANLAHQACQYSFEPGQWCAYKVAWIGACVLFDRHKLIDAGGFTFWPDLPADVAGEDVAAQWAVMERYGGAGILPSGAVHIESPTTVTDRSGEAFDYLKTERRKELTYHE